MNTTDKIGIVIQARMNSGRLPEKILKPFFKDESILEILLKKLIVFSNNQSNIETLVIATSNNYKDLKISSFAEKFDVNCFRGSEENVLQRFIEAGMKYDFKYIVRVCSDNPFLSKKYLNKLLETFNMTVDKADYYSYAFNGKVPAIKTHWGLFAEIVSLEALKKIPQQLEFNYREHVTNYIYENPKQFNINWISVPELDPYNNLIRLTVDNSIDFANSQEIYKYVNENKLEDEIEHILPFILSSTDIMKSMKENISNNSK